MLLVAAARGHVNHSRFGPGSSTPRPTARAASQAPPCRMVLCCSLVGVLHGVAVSSRRHHWCRCRFPVITLATAQPTDLLVDGDSYSITEVQDAIELLQKRGHAQVQTTVYAAPGRKENRRWRDFFKSPFISFCPVGRKEGGEANDERIVRDIRSKVLKVQEKIPRTFALLTADRDFVDIAREISHVDVHFLLIIPYRCVTAIQAFKAIGAHVLPLHRRVECDPKVRAVLRNDGGGSVMKTGPYPFTNVTKEVDAVLPVLEDLGYCPQGGVAFLSQAAAKFWYRNSLGSIKVYPAACAIKAVHRLIQHPGPGRKAILSRKWRSYRGDFAYVLPCGSKKGGSKAAAVREFGSLKARQIFNGGGPFIVYDSQDLAAEVLQRLGYLDGALNQSLAEAILVFINSAENKGTLRKMGFLPNSSDSLSTAVEKLRKAFMSPACSGIWQMVPSDRCLRMHLHKQGFLTTEMSKPLEVFKAMEKYADSNQLPRMDSYLGYAFWVMRRLRGSDPSQTGVASFAIKRLLFATNMVMVVTSSMSVSGFPRSSSGTIAFSTLSSPSSS